MQLPILKLHFIYYNRRIERLFQHFQDVSLEWLPGLKALLWNLAKYVQANKSQ